MAMNFSLAQALRGRPSNDADIRADAALLRQGAIVFGLCWSGIFVVVGLRYGLQMYGDGSLFSYAVAVQEVWAFHWHNIVGRLFSFLFSLLPAESYVALTGDIRGGISIYGFLHFVAPFLGLAATFLADRSKRRIIFTYACGSTACLCPLIFGFPTEMWMAHALFWPALAVCHYARGGLTRGLSVFLILLALVFTHEGAFVLAAVIVATLALRGLNDRAFQTAAAGLVVACAIGVFARLAVPPDDYFAPVLMRAALHVFNLTLCTTRMFLLLFVALASYLLVTAIFRRFTANADLCGAVVVALGLVTYWICFDRGIYTENRYYMRTLVLIGTAILGTLAGLMAVEGEGRVKLAIPYLPQIVAVLRREATARVAAGALAVMMLVHAVETAKFASSWTAYTSAIRALAMGIAADPGLGDPRFVASTRVTPDLNRLSWNSTTPYLSVLLAPDFAPARLVADPRAGYFWLSCAVARGNAQKSDGVPAQARQLIAAYACLHR